MGMDQTASTLPPRRRATGAISQSLFWRVMTWCVLV
jgi:hypothetical protein